MARSVSNQRVADLELVDALRAHARAAASSRFEIIARGTSEDAPSCVERAKIARDLEAAADRLELAAFGIEIETVALLALERTLAPADAELGGRLGATISRALARRGGK